MTEAVKKAAGGIRQQATDVITSQLRQLVVALGERAASNVADRIGGLTSKLSDIAEGKGAPGQVAALAGAKASAEGKSPTGSVLKAGLAGAKAKISNAIGLGGGGGGGGGGKKIKVINIIEHADVGLPLRVAYDQWTQFADFPSFMKKVESVDQESDEKTNWKAQVFWSHRTWEATIVEQIPDDHIVWKSKGAKGYVDGSISFHELAPSLTRIIMVLEYHPQGLFERTGNIWRAQGRRARLELKHFVRHAMTHTLIEQDDLEGWRGEIRDSQVVKSHEDAMREEQEQDQQRDEQEQDEQRDEQAQDEQRDEQEQDQDEQPQDQDEEAEDEPEAEADENDESDAEEDEEEETPRPARRPPARPRSERPRPARSSTPRRARQ
jgi:uncharacterized membrane protein